MKIKELDNGSLDVKITPKEQHILLGVFIHALIETGELVLDPETKEYHPSTQLQGLFGEVH